MTVIPRELIMAYEATDFRVLEPHVFTLRVGQRSAELQSLYVDLGVTCAAYLTAWNPYRYETSAAENALAQQSLIRSLSLDGYPTFQGLGVDPAEKWLGEASIFVPGLSLERAKSLGIDFGQNAIVWASDDAIPQLVLLR